MVAAFLRPWRGTAIRHIPAGSGFDVLDTRFACLAADNRWNAAGEPTIIQNVEGLSSPPLKQTLFAIASVLLVSAMALSLAGWAAKQPLKRYAAA